MLPASTPLVFNDNLILIYCFLNSSFHVTQLSFIQHTFFDSNIKIVIKNKLPTKGNQIHGFVTVASIKSLHPKIDE